MTVERRYALPRYLPTGLCVLLAALTLFSFSAPALGARDQAWETRRPARLAFATSLNNRPGVDMAGKAGDPTWNHGISEMTGMDGEIYAACEFMGSLVVTGDFVYIDGAVYNGLASFDGTGWSAFGTGLVGEIYTMYVIGDLLYVGGDFTSIDGNPAGNLATWDGSDWDMTIGDVDGPVYDIGTLNGDPAIVGDFTSIDGTPCNRFARYQSGWFDLGFSGDWSVETIYEDIVTTDEEPVTTLRTLYLGGDKLATWTEADAWITYDVNGNVNDIVRHRDNVIVGGHMDLIEEFPCDNAAAWNGTTWTEFGLSTYELLSLIVVDDRLYAAGRPAWTDTLANIYAKYRVQKKTIEDWASVRTVQVPNGPVNMICALGDSVVAVGLFDGFYHPRRDVVLGFSSPNIGVFYSDLWSPYGVEEQPVGFDGLLTDSTIYEDNLVVTGRFMSMNGDAAGGLGFYDGQTWYTPDRGPVDPMSYDPDLFFFNNYETETESQAPGFPALMQTIKANMHQVRGISSVAEYKGELYVAGDFYFPSATAGTITYRQAESQVSLSRLIGSSWTQPATNPFPPVDDLVVYNDSIFLVSRESYHLACYDADPEGGAFSGIVYPIYSGTAHGVNFDDQLYVSTPNGVYRYEGNWTQLADDQLMNASFFEVNGRLWASPESGDTGLYRMSGNVWEKVYSTDAQVHVVESYAGDLYIGGEFTEFEGQASSGLVYLRGDDVLVPDLALTYMDGASAKVNVLQNYYGNLILGGDFDLIGSRQSPYLGRWNSDTDAPELTIAIHQNPYATRFVDIYLMGDDTPLLPTDMVFEILEEPVTILPKDEAGTIWRAEYSIKTGMESIEIRAEAADYSWLKSSTTVPFTSKALEKGVGGTVASADGVVALNIAPDGLASDQTFLLARSRNTSSGRDKALAGLPGDMIILADGPRDPGAYTYAISSSGSLTRPAELVFSLDDAGDGDLLGWSVVRDDGETVDSYFDPETRTVRAYTQDLGGFTLSYDMERPVDLYDDAFLRVSGAWPNPFNPQTRIEFEIKARGPVTADVFDLKGRKIRTLLSEEMLPGTHELIWRGVGDDGMSVSSGIYMVRINAADQQVVRKITLLK